MTWGPHLAAFSGLKLYQEVKQADIFSLQICQLSLQELWMQNNKHMVINE